MVTGTANEQPYTDDDNYLVDPATAPQDVPMAQRAVVIHQPEQWPAGAYCRNEHVAHPCRLYRWGRDVLRAASWTDDDIADLVARAKRGDLPWVPRATGGDERNNAWR